MDRMDFIQQAKELTGSNDIEVILDAARRIEGYLTTDNTEPKWLPHNPADFLSYTKIIHPIRGIVSFQPYEFQRDIARRLFHYFLTPTTDPYAFLHVCARQMGNSTLMAAVALWFAMSSRKQKVLFLCPRMADCYDNRSRMHTMLDSLPFTFGTMGVKVQRDTIEFYNGSEISFGSLSSPRSLESFEEADLIILLDVGWLSYSHDSTYEAAIKTALEAGTKIVLSSCSNTDKGLFFDMVKAAPDHRKLITKWNAHPDRDDEWAKPYRMQLGPRRFLQEFECEFISEP